MVGLARLLCLFLAAASSRRKAKIRIRTKNQSLDGPPAFAWDDGLVNAIATSSAGGVVWIDVENVRGRSGFRLSHADVLDQVGSWIRRYESPGSSLVGKVILVVDHGSSHAGYWLPSRGCSVVFAGPHQKADDVLAKDVGIFSSAVPSVVVTADGELQRRCRRAGERDQKLAILSPSRLLDELSSAAMEDTLSKGEDENQKDVKEESNADIAHGTAPDDDDDAVRKLDQAIASGKLDAEIKWGGQLLEAESLMADKEKHMTNKRRKKLQKRIETIRTKLESRGPEVLERVSALLGSSAIGGGGKDRNGEGEMNDPVSLSQDALWIRWQQVQQLKPRREKTGDRVVLAERLRRHLVDSGEGTKDTNGRGGKEDDALHFSTAIMHTNYVNGYLDPNVIAESIAERKYLMKVPNAAESETDRSAINNNSEDTISDGNDNTGATLQELADQDPGAKLDELKVVVISDTHGYESQLAGTKTSDGVPILPDGDVLLHLGDFTLDEPFSSPREGWIRFDKFLAEQPHRFKIVVRGNHDPHRLNFAQSGAWYVTKPASNVNIGGFRLSLVPYGSSRVLAASRGLPSATDLLASHVPPRNILDECLNGRNAGSGFLNRVVHSMVEPPKVWVCGHIHEGRGVTERTFGVARSKVTVVNAANANPGRASHLVHGPVVLRLRSQKDGVEIVEMEDDALLTPQDSTAAAAKPIEMVLAVDVDGWDSQQPTASLFNDRGELVRVGSLCKCDGKEASLASQIESTAQSWQSSSILPPKSVISHVVVSGAPTGFDAAFARAAPYRTLLKADGWRSNVLSRRELGSDELAERSRRLAARQVVSEFGIHKTAEVTELNVNKESSPSLVLGMYAITSLLGWVGSVGPVLKRHAAGGAIVVPKGFG